MYDYNVVIREVDSAMDMLEAYSREANDMRAHLLFDLSSVFAAVDLKIEECERRIAEDSQYSGEMSGGDNTKNATLPEAQLERLLSIRAACSSYGQDLLEDVKDLFGHADMLVSGGLQEMGRYISKLNLLPEANPALPPRTAGRSGNVFVCVIDSARYPQTAEHIRTAQHIGLPSVLTIDRDNAAERRKASLEHVRTNRLYDRDEYPCAVFCEGGDGADVVYVAGSDNRGAGAYMRWQMQHMPDGSRVRIRVI